MPHPAEITCPNCRETFDHTFSERIPRGVLICPHCRQSFNCDACNYSWAKWARAREDCGAPCRKGK